MKRPYATHYYVRTNDKDPSFTSRGAASTEHGAIRATVVRIFLGQYVKAIVVDRELGVPIYTIRLQSTGLHITYGRERESVTELRRVK